MGTAVTDEFIAESIVLGVLAIGYVIGFLMSLWRASPRSLGGSYLMRQPSRTSGAGSAKEEGSTEPSSKAEPDQPRAGPKSGPQSGGGGTTDVGFPYAISSPPPPTHSLRTAFAD